MQKVHLRLDVTQGLLNLSVPRENTSENELSICATGAAGCERHQLRPKLKSVIVLFAMGKFIVQDSQIYTQGGFSNINS